MKRVTLYSRSHRPGASARTDAAVPPALPIPTPEHAAPPAPELSRYERWIYFAASAAVAAVLLAGYGALTPQRKLTQRDIDSAVLHTLEKQPPAPSRASVAYDIIRPSVVRVNQVGLEE